jgi:predicted ATPase
MNRAWRIDEADPPERIREKIEPRLQQLLEASPELIPYIGSLYALSYPQIEQVSPEFWLSRFIDAVKSVVTALARRGPTVFCFEDIHWADPPTLDLLRVILAETREPALFLCVYRIPFSLFPDSQKNQSDRAVEEVRLQDLSPDDAHRMLLSLFRIETIPGELSATILKKAEGNPFYLEEVTNSLMETGILIQENNHLTLTRPITESDVPSTEQGVISARFDRLGRDMKLVLQEASVIGRAFAYDILKRISQIRDNID